MTIWYWLRHREGELEPLDGAAMVAFLRGEQPLPVGDDGSVRYIGLEVVLDDGAVMDARRVWFSRCPMKDGGYLDQAAMLGVAKAKLEVARRLVDGEHMPSPEDVLIDASAHFEAKRLRHESSWEPSPRDLNALRDCVNARAGWTMI